MSENVDIALAFEALDHIKANPEKHNQGTWRCDTGMCFAGWVATVLGVEWQSEDFDNPVAKWDYVKVPEEYMYLFEGWNPEDIHVSDFVEKVLGLNTMQSSALFSSHNDAETIEKILLVLKDNPDDIIDVTKIRRERSEEAFAEKYGG